MKHLRIAAALIGMSLAACATAPTGDDIARVWYLTAVDGRPLPDQGDLPAGYHLVAESITFPSEIRPRSGGPETGMIRMARTARNPAGRLEASEVDLAYVITGSDIRINLCPPLALCIQQTELIGTIGAQESTMTHYLGGTATNTYRFVRAINMLM
jgi:hypothetical protein